MKEKINPVTHLSERQTCLIRNLLGTYAYSSVAYDETIIQRTIIFDGREYLIDDYDYPIVCEIIDYIKGVKQ